MARRVSFRPYTSPSGGWGSVRSLVDILRREAVPISGSLALTRQNKVDGFQCVSCAWTKPAKPLPFEFCENGAKATAWDLTVRRCTPEFFASHSVDELLRWPDHDLEQQGRLTQPLRYDEATDRYVAVSWHDAFMEIGAELKALADPNSAVFYSSGRTSNEASYLYALFARLYGTNNLPDSSNMCHETTSVALPESLGVPVGTASLEDFAQTDCILFFGQNPGSNSPRMLHALQAASRRGVPMIVYNPLRERGLERFTNPQSPTEMLMGESTRIASQYHQVKAGGDLAALTGICKALLAEDRAAKAVGGRPVLDHAFIADHTEGFADFAAWVERQEWGDVERQAGLSRAAMEATARTYAGSRSAIGIYGMGLTQHRMGVETVQMLVNLLLLRGNIGMPGAGICPVRGHSNVQGQRTVGITENPALVPLDRLAGQYGFSPPRDTGLNTVDACEAIMAGRVRAFVSLGGNFVRAIPDRDRMEPAWRRLRLTVNIATKLNRTALVHGSVSFLLPVLSRLETDIQGTGAQALSIEDTTAHVHGSRGLRAPASPDLLSEVRLVSELARATLPANPAVPWAAWADDYRLIRASIAETYPETFHDYEKRMWEPGGLPRPVPARKREWHTPSGKARIITPGGMREDPDMAPSGNGAVLRLITLRSNDQFNTTIYGYDDRFRGIHGTRDVLLINKADMLRLGFVEGITARVRTESDDGVVRELNGLRITPYDIPIGCVGAYYPEANVLLPMQHYALRSKTPAAKSIPVTIHRS